MCKLFFPFLTFLFLLSIISPICFALSCLTGCNHGNCVSPGTCACNTGYFNLKAPCDTGVASLTNKQYYQKNLPAASWIYFYVSLRHITSDVQLQFQVQGGTATAYILLQSPDLYNLPTANDESLAISPTDGDRTISYQIIKEKVAATDGGWLTLAIYNNNSSQAKIRVQYSATINPYANFKSSEDSDDGAIGIGSVGFMKMIVVLPVLGVGAILCIGVFVRARTQRRRRMSQQRIHLQVNPQTPGQHYELVIVVGQSPQNPQAQDVSQKTQEQNKFLSKEEISRYFPEKAFSQVKSPFPQPTCSICLEDFKPESICHQLYCCHVFHEACIEEWLMKHDSCPGCRKPITREAVKKFMEEEKKRRKEKRSPSVYNVNE